MAPKTPRRPDLLELAEILEEQHRYASMQIWLTRLNLDKDLATTMVQKYGSEAAYTIMVRAMMEPAYLMEDIGEKYRNSRNAITYFLQEDIPTEIVTKAISEKEEAPSPLSSRPNKTSLAQQEVAEQTTTNDQSVTNQDFTVEPEKTEESKDQQIDSASSPTDTEDTIPPSPISEEQTTFDDIAPENTSKDKEDTISPSPISEEQTTFDDIDPEEISKDKEKDENNEDKKTAQSAQPQRTNKLKQRVDKIKQNAQNSINKVKAAIKKKKDAIFAKKDKINTTTSQRTQATPMQSNASAIYSKTSPYNIAAEENAESFNQKVDKTITTKNSEDYTIAEKQFWQQQENLAQDNAFPALKEKFNKKIADQKAEREALAQQKKLANQAIKSGKIDYDNLPNRPAANKEELLNTAYTYYSHFESKSYTTTLDYKGNPTFGSGHLIMLYDEVNNEKIMNNYKSNYVKLANKTSLSATELENQFDFMRTELQKAKSYQKQHPNASLEEALKHTNLKVSKIPGAGYNIAAPQVAKVKLTEDDMRKIFNTDIEYAYRSCQRTIGKTTFDNLTLPTQLAVMYTAYNRGNADCFKGRTTEEEIVAKIPNSKNKARNKLTNVARTRNNLSQLGETALVKRKQQQTNSYA